MLGVFSGNLTEQIASALKDLGTKAALVVHGADGLDELSITGTNKITSLRNGEIKTFELNPKELGLPIGTTADLVGGEPEENAAITRAILGGQESGHKLNIVLLNAAAALSTETHDFGY